jgi:S-adenosylmethionine-diacylgycerolhomoserine-N-methlytransferase
MPAPDATIRMDRLYRHQRHIYDLSRKWFLFGRDALIDSLQPPSGAAICEVGCGTARNLTRIARRYPWTRLYGLDASAEMLRTAAARCAGAGGRIALRQGLAEDLDPAAMFGVRGGFDIVILSYVLSMVPDWRAALDAAIRAVRPGGSVELVDFAAVDRLPFPAGVLLGAWLARFGVTPRPEICDHLRDRAAGGAGRVRIRPVLGDYAFLARFDRAS